mgnify:CR=1 FL=1
MALDMLEGGHGPTVFDLDPAAERLTGAGACPREVGAASDVAVTMPPEPRHVETVVLGPDGVADGLRPGGVVVDTSTTDPQTSRRVGAEPRRRGLHVVESPVGKTPEHAATGTPTSMAGGEPGIIARVKPVLDRMGSEIFLCGGPGMGHAMKITNNLLATTVVAANTGASAIG